MILAIGVDLVGLVRPTAAQQQEPVIRVSVAFDDRDEEHLCSPLERGQSG
jgi:hypothetical protein